MRYCVLRVRLRIVVLAALAVMMLLGGVHSKVRAQNVPACPHPGSVVVAWHSIASQARTYALIQVRTGITQPEALSIASQCRFRGRVGFLAEFGQQGDAEWRAVVNRFGRSLGGQRVENIWLGAGREADGFVRWYQSRTSVRNISLWQAWAPNEPQPKTAVTFHSGYPGLLNSCDKFNRYTRLLVEFR